MNITFSKKHFLIFYLLYFINISLTVQLKNEPLYLQTLDNLTKKCFSELEEHLSSKPKSNYVKGINHLYSIHLNFIKRSNNAFIPAESIQNIIKQYIKKYCETLESKKNQDYAYLEKNVIPIKSKICIIGDIHGSFHSLLRILIDLNKNNFLENDFTINKDAPDFYMVFTGDYADRGVYGTEVWYTLLKLKMKNWNQVFLLRGNHETKFCNKMHCKTLNLIDWLSSDLSFQAELFSKYYKDEEIFKNFCTLYNYLPIGLYLGSGPELNQSWVLFSHGGLDPYFNSKEFIENEASVLTMKDVVSNKKFFTFNEKIINQLISPWIWSDFYFNVEKQTIEMFNRARNGSGEFITNDFLKKRKINAIFRGHQHHTTGLKIFTTELTESVEWDKATPRKQPNEGINISKHGPIFTFSTATEWGIIPHAFYGILETAEDFDDWKLYPNDIELKNPLT